MDLYTRPQTPKTAHTVSAPAHAGLGDGGEPRLTHAPFSPEPGRPAFFLISIPAKHCPGDTSSLILPHFIYALTTSTEAMWFCIVTYVGILKVCFLFLTRL